QGFGLVEFNTQEFKCPLCYRKNIAPIIAGFTKCRFRVRGIKMSGEQCTTDWTTVDLQDGYLLYNSEKQASWCRLIIESVKLDGAATDEKYLMCLRRMNEHKELQCGHRYHAEYYGKWNRCPTCHYNKHLSTGCIVQIY
ncbi:hypothetical protein CPC16_000963, partial [Podila verticillata]